MKKQTKIIIAIVAIIAVVAIVLAIVFINQQPKTNLKPIETAEDLSQLIEEVYEGQENLLSTLNTTIVEYFIEYLLINISLIFSSFSWILDVSPNVFINSCKTFKLVIL